MIRKLRRRLIREFEFRKGGFYPTRITPPGTPPSMVGSQYGGWSILPDLLSAESTVYSFGLGKDISFDLGVIERFGCQVFGFDPTVHSVNYLETLSLPDQFTFCAYGLSDHDGELVLYEPPSGSVSHTLVSSAQNNTKVSIPVKCLSTILKDLRHETLDVLKMDIEGCEYEVIDDLLSLDFRPTQLLVEFHHKVLNMGLAKTKTYFERLVAAGYRPFYISGNGNEFSFFYEPGLNK